MALDIKPRLPHTGNSLVLTYLGQSQTSSPELRKLSEWISYRAVNERAISDPSVGFDLGKCELW